MEDRKDIAVGGALDNLANAGSGKTERHNGDFYANGLLYCGKCGLRKERYVKLFNGAEKKVRVMCACQEAAMLREKELERKRQEEQRLSTLRTNSMMDVRYNGVTFDGAIIDDKNKEIIDLCRRYAERFDEFYKDNQGILMYGDVGTGKSYAAACIANHLLAKGTSVIMTSFVKILELIGKFDGTEADIMNRLTNARLVIFDDLGAERKTDYALEKVFDIVDSRYRYKKPMIFTTNLNANDMMREDDIRFKRIYDRIFEVCYPLEFTGGSWRKSSGEDKWARMKGLGS